jgi:transcriptional regulator GlxA family with amidase domain
VLPDGRVFEQHVGYGPKKLARILRLRRTLRLIDSRGAANLAAVALDAGYYDQSHMNADFRDLAGCPPLASRDG